jgi:DNA-binding CsgD family transcriptional regulator
VSWTDLFLVPVAAALSPLDHVLVGMVAAGLGVEALCLYLGLSRDALFMRIVALDLRTPHDRPLRKPSGKTPWTGSDVHQLIAWWVEGLTGVAIAEQLGRSPGAVYSKARRLGLPRRQRKLLCRAPAAIEALRQHPQSSPSADVRGDHPSLERFIEQLRAPAPAPARFPLPQDLSRRIDAARREAGLDLLPRLEVLAPAPGAPRIGKQKAAFARTWTPELEHELSLRVWAGQYYKDIAEAMAMSTPTVASRMTLLEIPLGDIPERRRGNRPPYDEAVALKNIKACDMVEGYCRRFHRIFWGDRCRSQRDLSKAGRVETLASFNSSYA